MGASYMERRVNERNEGELKACMGLRLIERDRNV